MEMWSRGRAGRMPDRDSQITIMNARAIALIAQDRARWPHAGDHVRKAAVP
jgi:hypothetical protein